GNAVQDGSTRIYADAGLVRRLRFFHLRAANQWQRGEREPPGRRKHCGDGSIRNDKSDLRHWRLLQKVMDSMGQMAPAQEQGSRREIQLCSLAGDGEQGVEIR